MRTYTVGFQNVSVSAIQDLVAVYSGASGAFEIHDFTLGQTTQTTVGNLRLRGRRLPATVTAGAGGSAGTVNKTRSGDAAATVTARVNDTTQATTSGTAADVVDDVYNPVNGYQFLPPPEDRPACNPSEAWSWSLDQAPGSAQTTNAKMTLAELIPV